MNSSLKFVALAALFATYIGCGATSEPSVDETSEPTVAVAVYCGHCGNAEGGEKCCVKGAERCLCGMDKGSPLCCKLGSQYAGKTMCGECGHVAGGPKCCEGEGEKCKCGMEKGSPLCCKLDK